MPFRCKCGRTFEKTDTFATHTSACAPFHQRRLSFDIPSQPDQQRKKPAAINTSTLSFIPSGLRSPLSPSQFSPRSASLASSSPPASMDHATGSNESFSSSGFMMPIGLSLHNAFEGARRRSMSYESSYK